MRVVWIKDGRVCCTRYKLGRLWFGGMDNACAGIVCENVLLCSLGGRGGAEAERGLQQVYKKVKRKRGKERRLDRDNCKFL